MPRKTGHEGLVLRDVDVTVKGKKFKRKQWVKPGDEEPKERKGKKEEVKGNSKDKESFKIGRPFEFMGKKQYPIKIDEKQQTIKLNDGKVYTFEAIEYGMKLKEVKEETKVKDLKPKPKKEEEKPKEKSIKDLKSKPKKEIETKDIPDKESKVIKGSTKDGSLSAKDRKNADKELQEFINREKEQEIKGGIHDFDRMSGAAKQYTAGSSFMMTAYLLNDRKKGYDFETRGLKNIDKEEREWYEKKIKLLDEFLDKAPKVETTSYRGMHWDMSDEHESKLYKTFIDEMKVGEVIESKAYSSTTVSKSILSDYSSSRISGIGTSKYAKIEYKTKSGVYIASESQTYEQLEVLLPHHTKFEVVKNEIKGNTHIIKLREVS